MTVNQEEWNVAPMPVDKETTAKPREKGSRRRSNTLIFNPPLSSITNRLSSTSQAQKYNQATTLIPVAYHFDVIRELEDNRDKYIVYGPEACWLSINLPMICKVSTNRLRARVESYKPGINPTLAACIHNGLEALSTEENIQSMVGLRSRFEMSDINIDSELQQLLAQWFFSFDVDVLQGEGARSNVSVSSHIFNPLSQLAYELGMSNPKLAVIAIMATLCHQTEVSEGDRNIMEGHVLSFIKRSGYRARTTRAMLEEFKL